MSYNIIVPKILVQEAEHELHRKLSPYRGYMVRATAASLSTPSTRQALATAVVTATQDGIYNTDPAKFRNKSRLITYDLNKHLAIWAVNPQEFPFR
jgi:hypothetical protein